MTKNEFQTIIMIILKKAVNLILRAAYLFILFWILSLSLLSVVFAVLSVVAINASMMPIAAVLNGVMMTVNMLTALIARHIDRFTYLTHIVITFVHGVFFLLLFFVSMFY